LPSQSQGGNANPSGDGEGDNHSGGGKSNAGAIAGGVVGGIVGLAIIGSLIWFSFSGGIRQSMPLLRRLSRLRWPTLISHSLPEVIPMDPLLLKGFMCVENTLLYVLVLMKSSAN